jgi:hypothetical protein
MDVQSVLDGATCTLLDISSETEEADFDSTTVVYLEDLSLAAFTRKNDDSELVEALKLFCSLIVDSYIVDIMLHRGKMGLWMLLVPVAAIVGGETILASTEETLSMDELPIEQGLLDRIWDAVLLVGTVLLLLDVAQAIEL